MPSSPHGAKSVLGARSVLGASSVLRTSAAAAYCGSSASTFQKLRMTGDGPVYSKLGRRVVYRIEDLHLWLVSKRQQSTSDPVAHPTEQLADKDT